MAMRLSLGEMLVAGTRALGRYTGTLLSVFVVQLVVVIVCMIAISSVLANAFASLPLWDEAVDGDLVALFHCFYYGWPNLEASISIALWTVLVWQVVSWFLIGGIHGVLGQRPEGRGETARCFGASGAATFLPYLRLTLISLPGYLLVLVLSLQGYAFVDARLGWWPLEALTMPQLFGPLLLSQLPALLLLHALWTVTDYARAELSLRHDSHDPGVVMTYLRTLAFVLKRPMTLVHAGLGWIAFALITVAYMYLAHGHSMYGAEGAITLFVIRQGVALARTAIRFGVLAGQLELGKTRPLPPRRLETKTDTKKS